MNSSRLQSQSSREPETKNSDNQRKSIVLSLFRSNRWQSISRKTKVIFSTSILIVATIATFITNIEKIQNFYLSLATKPSVPPITVKLSNSASENIKVSTRGDFFLWLPGPDARHYIGKYEFKLKDNSTPSSLMIEVKPDTNIAVYAHLLNQNLYSKILQQGECDIMLHIQLVNGGLKFTEDMPFTKEALYKYYVTADVGVE